jgi:integrase/recombinase XerC
LRSLFRRHRELSGAGRVRPHRLRHTYGTELASAGIDLLALRALMGHVSPETTTRYVHLSIEQLAAEYGALVVDAISTTGFSTKMCSKRQPKTLTVKT